MCLKDTSSAISIHPGLPDHGINIRKQKSSIWDFWKPSASTCGKLPGLNTKATRSGPFGEPFIPVWGFSTKNIPFARCHFDQGHTSLAGRKTSSCFLVCACSFRLSGEDFGFAFSSAHKAVLCIVAIASSSTSDPPPGMTGTLGYLAMNLPLRRMRFYCNSV